MLSKILVQIRFHNWRHVSKKVQKKYYKKKLMGALNLDYWELSVSDLVCTRVVKKI